MVHNYTGGTVLDTKNGLYIKKTSTKMEEDLHFFM